ncbi:hypothetical protein CHS0354_026499 [Potamilus streckersoni]|uniref:Uncharacterized protein n=1 Tax=Potamilus streckersoni TaxID=2493646 RepID=A0AAE0RQ72_9BIVA|nr:hypothetical protein CHS0354_026499 [Potamilus streckersoni]
MAWKYQSLDLTNNAAEADLVAVRNFDNNTETALLSVRDVSFPPNDQMPHEKTCSQPGRTPES